MDTLFGFDDLAENRSPKPAAEPACRDSESSADLGREQVIARIIGRNKTASAAFLDQFSDTQLRHYLDHLRFADHPRNLAIAWSRPGDTPAITGARSVA
ncbi:MAG TPA: hypothetical protein ENJ00_07740 [Phycisphaerales bacterium]|nr:hypothetical protein [Phycisphaerales bacterium]